MTDINAFIRDIKRKIREAYTLALSQNTVRSTIEECNQDRYEGRISFFRTNSLHRFGVFDAIVAVGEKPGKIRANDMPLGTFSGRLSNPIFTTSLVFCDMRAENGPVTHCMLSDDDRIILVMNTTFIDRRYQYKWGIIGFYNTKYMDNIEFAIECLKQRFRFRKYYRKKKHFKEYRWVMTELKGKPNFGIDWYKDLEKVAEV